MPGGARLVVALLYATPCARRRAASGGAASPVAGAQGRAIGLAVADDPAVLLGEILKLLGGELGVERHDVLALHVLVGGRALDEHRRLALLLVPDVLRLGRGHEG